MAKYAQINGQRKKVITTEGGITWHRNSGLGHYERGNWETELYGVRYEIEKRKWSQQEPDCDTGWYLYSFNAPGGFFGEWCGKTILEAAEAATSKIHQRDLRTEKHSS